MTPRLAGWRFFAVNIVMWLVMTVILVLVPDTLDRWLPLEIARVTGWAVASGLWVVALQQPWRQRVGPFTLFTLQLAIWVSAAVVAILISEAARPPQFNFD
jgi:hypothetical protein